MREIQANLCGKLWLHVSVSVTTVEQNVAFTILNVKYTKTLHKE